MKNSLTLVDYKTFVSHLNNEKITDLKIYKFSSEVELTYKLDGTLYGSKKTYGLDNDALLHQTLDNKSIKYTILKEKYEGAQPSMASYGTYAGFGFMLLPLIMVIVIVIQARTIKTLSQKILKQSKDM